jgi:hypothetical protein
MPLKFMEREVVAVTCVNFAVKSSFMSKNVIYRYIGLFWDPGQLSWCRDWLSDRWQRVRSSSSGEVKNFLISTSSRSTPPIQWVRGFVPQE